jgi:Tfp pilus assembly protein PilV
MPKTSVAQHPLVMIRTFSARLRVHGRSSIGRRSLAAEAGDTLIEVIVSALLLGIIVVGTFTGLNSTNKSTSIARARSQANALAEQDEDRLRSLPVTTLAKLETAPEAKTVEQNGAKYTVTSSARYVIDNTATTSCASTALSAEYIQTTSTVTATILGGHSVVETGIVSPPPDTALVVQVTNQLGEGVPSAEVQATGPSSGSALTSASGCAIIALSPGEYKVNVHKAGYVDQNWFKESKEDSFYTSTVYLTAETTTKKQYLFAPAAALNSPTSEGLKFEELNPVTDKDEPARSLNAVLENGKMSPTFRVLPVTGTPTYVASLQTEKIIYPFNKESYTAYAGSCQANKPVVVGFTKSMVEEYQPAITFFPEKETSGKVVLPSLVVDVWEGTATTPKKLVKATTELFLSDTDEGCEHTWQKPKTVAPVENPTTKVLEYPKGGALEYPGQPWGTYTVCLNDGSSKYIKKEGVKNDHPEQAGTPVNFYEGEGFETGQCP